MRGVTRQGDQDRMGVRGNALQAGPRGVDRGPAGDDVRDFYDRHPYPPPVANLDRYRRESQDPKRRRADYHLLWPATAYREDEEILIAGCGTSQAAKYAIRYPGARITGIDVSSTSLEHTTTLRRRYGLTNLELHELPLERIDELVRSFDRIVCTGVLHHLVRPDAGLRALRAVLKPEGAIHLMVYAPYGRIGIHMLQEYCRRVGVRASDADIRELIAVLGVLPRHHPLAYLLRDTPDFARADALADALLNPRDRAYSVPQLFDFIERSGLTFGRWYRQAPYLPQCGDVGRTPHGPRLARLSEPAGYAAVELLRGTLARHSVIAYRNDLPQERWRIRFDDDRWHGAVPLRLPHTVCVGQPRPRGAAAVLLNRSHPYPDLVLPVGPDEKRLFDAIDGSRTVAEIMRQASLNPKIPAQRKRAHTFFERLWWYDQVVFDGSAHALRVDSAVAAVPVDAAPAGHASCPGRRVE